MVTPQESYFLKSLGDEWFRRNKSNMDRQDDILLEVFDGLSNFAPKSVLEIGCANGWRLQRIKDRYGCKVHGIDPSSEAIEAGRLTLGEVLHVGVASNLPFQTAQFDTVIFGGCLCLCDPESWLGIIAESNRVLKNTGLLFILDYALSKKDGAVDDSSLKVATWPYKHDPEVIQWFVDWKLFWMAHPGYNLIAANIQKPYPNGGTSVIDVCVFQKNMPIRPGSF